MQSRMPLKCLNSFRQPDGASTAELDDSSEWFVQEKLLRFLLKNWKFRSVCMLARFRALWKQRPHPPHTAMGC